MVVCKEFVLSDIFKNLSLLVFYCNIFHKIQIQNNKY